MTNNLISLDSAITLTSQYRSNKETILGTAYKDAGILPICETFERSAFDTLLAQSGCESVRAYFGMDSNSKVKLVFVGVDSSGADMVSTTSETNVVLENGIRCPTTCPADSVLNTD